MASDILGPIDHVAFVVEDLDRALATYVDRLGFTVLERREVPDQGVLVCFLDATPVRIELIQPVRPDTGVARFLQKRGEGQHHVCFRVSDIRRALARLAEAGFEIIDPEPRPGLHGLIAFVHPRSTHGVLIELVQVLHDTHPGH